MQFKLTTQQATAIKTDCLVVPIVADKALSTVAKQVDKATSQLITNIIASGELNKAQQMVFVPAVATLSAKNLLLVCVGDNEKLSYERFTDLFTAIVQRLKTTQCQQGCFLQDKISVKDHDQAWSLQQAIIHLSTKDYVFDTYKSTKHTKKMDSWCFHVGKTQLAKMKNALNQATAINAGVALTKDLANTPCNIATPDYLGKQALRLAEHYKAVHVTVHDEKALKKLNAGGILAVGAGSQHESRLIEVHYKGSRSKQAPIVFVGKGVTFDTGGISIKPAATMDEMKYDMGGAATLFGVIKAIAELKLPINVSAIIPSAENMPDGASYKPGDVITSLSGQTIEIINTDAEGRLLLCDGLTYAKRFNPAMLIDIATLTGAMVVALGTVLSGYFTDNEALAKQVANASASSMDDAWRMPLRQAFVKQTDSKVADMRNTGPRWGGACSAAGFLSRFVEPEQCWMHMDIAGVANVFGNSTGATGRPVPLLVELLKNIKR